jgi:5-methylcytosine-specific restriction endonuclease McrA
MSTSKYKGVCYDKHSKKYRCQIRINYKLYDLGRFEKEENAVEAYNKFIEENKNILPERTKNPIKRRDKFERNKEGLIERNCHYCGKLLKFKIAGQVKNIIQCRNCCQSIKIPEKEMEQIIKEYEGGISYKEIGSKHSMSTMTIRNKLIKNNYKLRSRKETTKLTNKKHGNINKAHLKVKEMCETGEFQKQQSAVRQGIPIEEWKEFITPKNLQYYKSEEYQNWRKSVLKRDNYICQLCKKGDCELHAHHILPKRKFWDLREDIQNGITLCRSCHFRLNGKEHLYAKKLQNILILK